MQSPFLQAYLNNQTTTSAAPIQQTQEVAQVQSAPIPAIIEEKKDEFVKKEVKLSLLERLYTKFFPNKKEDEKFNSNRKNFTSTIINTTTTLSALGATNLAKKSSILLGCFNLKGSKELKIASAIVPFATALVVRPILNTINNIGADKEVKKENKSGFNILSNGLSACLMSYNPILTPVAFAINSLTSYVSFNKEKSNLNGFVDSHKDTLLLDALALGTILFASLKGKNQVSKLQNALQDAKANIANPILYRMTNSLTEFQALARDLGFDLGVIVNKKGELDISKIATLDEELMGILLDKNLQGDIDGKMRKIEEMNIFLPKYFQTVVDIPDDVNSKMSLKIDDIIAGWQKRKEKGSFSTDGNFATNYAIDEVLNKLEEKGLTLEGLKDYQEIIRRIKSDCIPSRTVDDAQKMIDKAYGAGKYTIIRGGKKDGLLGVGSIAESYIAKNESNEEVVIKLVKESLLGGTKVDEDKAKLLKKIEEKSDIKDGVWIRFGPDKHTITTKEQQTYDIQQIENMCKVWKAETDLSQEALSAQQIGAQASKYQAIKPIDSKDGIFIMEKAKGIQLDDPDIAQKWMEAGLGEEDFARFVDNYISAYCEQLFSLPKTGEKVVQSDPHGGNILVDLSKIKTLGQKDAPSPITIIDYGNTTKTTRTVATKNLFNHIDYLVGNTQAIAENILEGSSVNAKDRKKIAKQLSDELKKNIFNCDTKIDVNNPIEVFRETNAYCLEFMRKNNIIPNASNINQMKAEETYILSNLGCLKRIADGCGYDVSKAFNKKQIIKQLIGEMSKSTASSMKTDPIFTIKQLASRIKFILDDPERAFSCLGANFEVL